MSEQNIPEIEIKVNGMMCDGCENTVSNSLRMVNGVIEASASHTAGMAHVKYDASKTNLLFLKQAINNTL